MSNTAQGSARERIESLLDDNSFVEIGAAVTKRNTDFNLQQKAVPADGVITGYGIIAGNPVYVYSQDASSLGGSLGEMHAKKICCLYDLALKVGAPVIGLVDCAGLRLQEATDALAGFGEIYLKQSMASGVIPQITGIFGTCGGGAAVLSALSDFTLISEKSGSLYVNSPNAIEGNHIGKENTGSAAFQAANGNVDVVCEDDSAVLAEIRELVSILPCNNEDDDSYEECTDDLNRQVPAFGAESADAAECFKDISDNNYFFEVKADFAKEMVTGFIRLNGMTVGAVGNRSAVLDEEMKPVEKLEEGLSVRGCNKAADFVSFCDAFGIPVLTLTNVSGYRATMCSEKNIAKAAARLTHAFAEATVPKVNIIAGKAFGSAYITMNSKHIGADMVFALPTAEIGMMDAKLAATIMYGADAPDIMEKAAEYSALQGSAESAARRGYVDSIIGPAEVRQQVIFAFEMLFTKRESRPSRKHATV